jgi:hypothetical protein
LRVEADRCASIEASPCAVAVAVCGVYADAAYCGPISGPCQAISFCGRF